MDEQVFMLSRALCADLDTPISLGVYLRMKYDEWDSYLAMSVDPVHNYSYTAEGAEKFRRDSQAVNILRKYPDLNTSYDKTAAAVNGFWDCEKLCAKTNLRLRPFLSNFGLTESDGTLMDKFILPVQRLISKILGPLPDVLEPKFGPGTTYEAKRHKGKSQQSWTVLDKISYGPSCTPLATTLVQAFIGPTAWGRSVFSYLNPLGQTSEEIDVVRGNRFTTVPKTAKTDRGICIEPGGNVALQLAVGQHIRGRLLRFGLDLNYGQDVHRELARLGSREGHIATMDLSSASDTVSYNLVKLLLPELWFDVLDALRSPVTEIGYDPSGAERDVSVRLEKFSSMGNGFTFELETLLFAAITSVVCGKRLGDGVWVYGDDIIYPSHHSVDLSSALKWCGFIPNKSKSFSTGPFRESCGGDYFLGRNVRSYFIKEPPREPSDWISIHNGLDRFADGTTNLRNTRRLALSYIPTAVRMLKGPSVLGDLVIHCDDVSRWVTKVVDGIRYVKVWKPIQARRDARRYRPSVLLAAALYGAITGDVCRGSIDLITGHRARSYQPPFLVPRDSVEGYRECWVPA